MLMKIQLDHCKACKLGVPEIVSKAHVRRDGTIAPERTIVVRCPTCAYTFGDAEASSIEELCRAHNDAAPPA